MKIEDSLQTGQFDLLKEIRIHYDPVIADEIEPAIDRLLACKIHTCNMAKNGCVWCDSRHTCAIYLRTSL